MYHASYVRLDPVEIETHRRSSGILKQRKSVHVVYSVCKFNCNHLRIAQSSDTLLVYISLSIVIIPKLI